MTEEEKEAKANGDLFLDGLQIIMNEFDDKMTMEEMAHCFLSMGFDMVHHLAQHTLPGESFEKVNGLTRNHIIEVLDRVEEAVWVSN